MKRRNPTAKKTVFRSPVFSGFLLVCAISLAGLSGWLLRGQNQTGSPNDSSGNPVSTLAAVISDTPSRQTNSEVDYTGSDDASSWNGSDKQTQQEEPDEPIEEALRIHLK